MTTRKAPSTAPRKPRAKARTVSPGAGAIAEMVEDEPGPADAHSPLVWTELRRATIWVSVVGAAALIVLLIQPILFIIGAVVIAVMLDGGTRLLGRVLPIARGWRLAIVVLAVLTFLVWTFYTTGSQLAQQAAALPQLVQSQFDRVNGWLTAHGINLGLDDLRSAASQVMGSLGRVTAAISTAAGIISSLVMMLVLAIFLSIEPQLYARGLAWFVPLAHREEAHGLTAKLGWTLRRLMAGRLVGMAVEGVGTWILLMIGGVPMAALLGVLTGLLAFLPNIGSIISGALIILVGFSVDANTGIYAFAVYLAVQMVDGYLIVPTVAQRAVDMPPALVLGAQILFGAIFGIIGLALADPIVAMLKVILEERAKMRMAKATG